MSKTSQAVIAADISGTEKPALGFWRRMLSGFAKARELQAEREVARYFANRPDRYLADIGMSGEEIAKLRRTQAH